MGANKYVLAACLAAMGAATPTWPSPLVAPTIALVGDSITAYGNVQTAVASGTTITSDGAGNLTATVSNQAYGNPEVYLNNLNNSAYELAGRNTYNASSISIAEAGLAAGTTTAGTFGAMTLWDRFTGRGIFLNLKSLFQGGIEFGGNYGHGGQLASAMSAQLAYALSRSPSMVILMTGTNDIHNGGVSAATVWSSINALIQQCITAGVPVVVCAVTPVGTAFTGSAYATVNGTGANGIQTLNALIKAGCASTPTKTVYADTFTPMYDPVNLCAYPHYVISDGLHPTAAGAIIMATAVQTAMSAWVTAPVLLPTSATDTGSVNGHAKFLLKGPWVTTNGGIFATGVTASTGAGSVGQLNYLPPSSGGLASSGGLPPGWEGLRGVGSPTATCSIFDPNDGKGCKVQLIVQPAAANDSVSVAPIWNGTLTSLGLVQGDEICFAAEVDWSNANNSGLGAVSLTLQSNSSGAYGQATAGETTEATGVLPDSMTGRILVTGWLKINNASLTQLQVFVNGAFSSAGASPGVINARRFTIFKR